MERSLPFGPYTTATKALVDSLYFSLNTGVLQMEFQATELNEPFYNAGKQVINGKYTDESYNTKKIACLPAVGSSYYSSWNSFLQVIVHV